MFEFFDILINANDLNFKPELLLCNKNTGKI